MTPLTSVVVLAMLNPNAGVSPMVEENRATAAARLGVLAPGTGLPVGTMAPAVAAVDLAGQTVDLASLYRRGPILLAFYRGGWCPYCNLEIHALSAAFPEYQRRGVTPVAVSVDRPEAGAETTAEYKIPFPVLSDADAKVLDAFHVAKLVQGPERQMMKAMFGVDIDAHSGKTHHKIAIPSLFLIDRDGIVRWAHSDPDFKVRPTTKQILAALDASLLSRTGSH